MMNTSPPHHSLTASAHHPPSIHGPTPPGGTTPTLHGLYTAAAATGKSSIQSFYNSSRDPLHSLYTSTAAASTSTSTSSKLNSIITEAPSSVVGLNNHVSCPSSRTGLTGSTIGVGGGGGAAGDVYSASRNQFSTGSHSNPGRVANLIVTLE